MKATAIAHTNIALAKYWGKRDTRLNLPAVGSISVTLKDLYTRTAVRFNPEIESDKLFLNGIRANEKQVMRISRFLDLIRQRVNCTKFAEVTSENNFPTGAGLASSASGFAALALAATRAADLTLPSDELSKIARQGSGSAARSIFGGFVEMKMGQKGDGSDSFAIPLSDENYWPLTILIAVTSEEEKTTGSTEGMKITAETSPFFEVFVNSSINDLSEMRSAIMQRDLEHLGEIAEHSCLKMHALMLSARPALIYWNSATVSVMHKVREMRNRGIQVYFTIDAGPQVKVICEQKNSEKIKNEIKKIPGIKKIFKTSPGPAAKIVGEVF